MPVGSAGCRSGTCGSPAFDMLAGLVDEQILDVPVGADRDDPEGRIRRARPVPTPRTGRATGLRAPTVSVLTPLRWILSRLTLTVSLSSRLRRRRPGCSPCPWSPSSAPSRCRGAPWGCGNRVSRGRRSPARPAARQPASPSAQADAHTNSCLRRRPRCRPPERPNCLDASSLRLQILNWRSSAAMRQRIDARPSLRERALTRTARLHLRIQTRGGGAGGIYAGELALSATRAVFTSGMRAESAPVDDDSTAVRPRHRQLPPQWLPQWPFPWPLLAWPAIACIAQGCP